MGEDLPDDLVKARDGDHSAFTRLVRPMRGELHAHCYRMLGSAHDADDALQETLLRAWRGLAGFEGRSSLRTWLYTVASRSCLDLAEHRGRRALPVDFGPSGAPEGVAWLGPYPGDFEAGPGARYEQREATELAFAAALQHLPANQRTTLLLFDVLGFATAEIAGMLGVSATAVNSALARARRTIAAKGPAESQQRTLRKLDDEVVRARVAGFADALERGEVERLVAHLTEDVTWSMPPLPEWYRGIDAVTAFAVRVPITGCGQWRCLPITANGQPAVACCLRDDGDTAYRSWSINVFTLREDGIAAITSFLGPEHFVHFGLPASLE
ncbi:sigma-70 family RNA polymerase sigma factor [Amycolatopsis albispora]|uniref:RNA polymerase subunit sigma-70 n=1 Tax=Amycolatopsis albispora TaxID=1804986 RepID=A0A344L5L4_9PSEU|nr:sigma-70 family RNA polymerase sigma factor [Amycolatopsis albispora]AXB43338.1 RNA polymerase subunit sigma-70 [Amycolatopsis albispora]